MVLREKNRECRIGREQEDQKYRRQEQAEAGHQDVHFLGQRDVARGEKRQEFPVEVLAGPLHPLLVAGPELLESLREVLVAGNVLNEVSPVPLLTQPCREGQVLRYDLRKTADQLPQVAANDGAMAIEDHESMLVPWRLVDIPVIGDAQRQILGETRRLARVLLMVGLDEGDIFSESEIGDGLAQEIRRKDLVGIHDRKIGAVLRVVLQRVVEIAGLVRPSVGSSHDRCPIGMLALKGVNRLFVRFVRAIVQEIDVEIRIALADTGKSGFPLEVVSNGVKDGCARVTAHMRAGDGLLWEQLVDPEEAVVDTVEPEQVEQRDEQKIDGERKQRLVAAQHAEQPRIEIQHAGDPDKEYSPLHGSAFLDADLHDSQPIRWLPVLRRAA